MISPLGRIQPCQGNKSWAGTFFGARALNRGTTGQARGTDRLTGAGVPVDQPSSSGGSSSAVGGESGSVDSRGGATALCNDGTLSYSAHHRSTCSHHHGVAVRYR
ncbi:DUF3761 domain-containing protein [Peterkaempfera bronchialis]|uniref:DUF3761 domain-containing protein n=1 Tax=Peterkaempfera bronchialis TaxID=2126346 RepID=UPI003C2B161C